MIRRNPQFARTLVLASIAAIGLVATSAPPALAGSGGFSNTGSMNVARIDHTATLLSNGEVLVAGGNNNTDGYLSSAEVYHPSSGKWTLTGSMTVPRDGHDAVLLQNGEVLVAGGIDASTNGCTTLPTAELYNSSTGTWTGTGSMNVGRYSFTLTLLPNGEVLAAGGTNCGNGGLLSAELYNPATRTWRATGTMTSGNQNTGAVLLQNGRVFVVGNDNIYNPSAGTWSRICCRHHTRRPHVQSLHSTMDQLRPAAVRNDQARLRERCCPAQYWEGPGRGWRDLRECAALSHRGDERTGHALRPLDADLDEHREYE